MENKKARIKRLKARNVVLLGQVKKLGENPNVRNKQFKLYCLNLQVSTITHRLVRLTNQ